MLFYTKQCLSCLSLVPHFNSLVRNFRDIKIGALDAFDFPGLNTDFGIIGLPTIILFHNGRMIQKFNTTQQLTVTNLVNFITSNTNLKPNSSNIAVTSEDFSSTSLLKITMQEESFDPYLWMSYIFIVVCAIYYFVMKSRTYQQIVEMINRTWRESNEAQMQG
jgi:thioredoxin-like negative regulator of GroEL